jgi:hypothetical protein
MTIQELKNRGYKVKVRHFRYGGIKIVDAVNLPTNFVAVCPLLPEKEIAGPNRYPRGGKTVVQVTSPGGKDYDAVAECSLKDGFDRKRGVRICLGRIEQEIQSEE